jgi:hypothetical protein
MFRWWAASEKLARGYKNFPTINHDALGVEAG